MRLCCAGGALSFPRFEGPQVRAAEARVMGAGLAFVYTRCAGRVRLDCARRSSYGGGCGGDGGDKCGVGGQPRALKRDVPGACPSTRLFLSWGCGEVKWSGVGRVACGKVGTE